jgi:hypothetical protein
LPRRIQWLDEGKWKKEIEFGIRLRASIAFFLPTFSVALKRRTPLKTPRRSTALRASPSSDLMNNPARHAKTAQRRLDGQRVPRWRFDPGAPALIEIFDPRLDDY